MGIGTVHEFAGDEIPVIIDALGVQAMPSVLRLDQQQTGADVDLSAAHRDSVRGRLRDRGELDDSGNVDLEVRGAVQAATAPDWMVGMVRIDVTQVLRVCLVGVGERRFVLSRNGTSFTTSELHAGDDISLVQTEIGSLVGEAPGASIREINQPSEVIDRDLDGCETSDDYAAAFFRYGLDETDARTLADALLSCNGQTQIVAHGDRESERTAIAVFDTNRGRIVSIATPSVSGERWTSIAPGDRSRIAAALRQLAHTLPGGVS
ncbi:ESX secretion-associated protein EspG [Williamsia sp. Leaf354]|uniref:ESX secretion-associated protein EspG n=1 Tax=Williamsia sp. Leaf354 TaxID=1736349 RepID=UPI000B113BDE|nr:ESX secretion-associated protein EspG [Williamsia sp. Leaf354]